MSTVSSAAEQRVVLRDVDWATYEMLVGGPEGRGQRMAYDEGVLEIMSPSLPHENIGRLIGRMVEAFTEELGIEICSVASTTFRRPDVRKGFEADESYYIANAPTVRDKDEVDLTIHPPPDLAIGIDISRTSMNKFRIYGALGVPEVWLYSGDALHVYVHVESEQYRESDSSTVLPQLPMNEVARFLDMRSSLHETQLIRAFRKWVREHFETDT